MPARTIPSPIGNLTIVVENAAVTSLDWHHPSRSSQDSVLDRVEYQLERYFSGHLEAFDLPLAPHGTPHELAVWRELCSIPTGQTRSYGEIARTIGSSPRAVGGACGRNPIPVIIPCHRVVATNGDLRGYSGAGGAETKQFLLTHEAAKGITNRLI